MNPALIAKLKENFEADPEGAVSEIIQEMGEQEAFDLAHAIYMKTGKDALRKDPKNLKEAVDEAKRVLHCTRKFDPIYGGSMILALDPEKNEGMDETKCVSVIFGSPTVTSLVAGQAISDLNNVIDDKFPEAEQPAVWINQIANMCARIVETVPLDRLKELTIALAKTVEFEIMQKQKKDEEEQTSTEEPGRLLES